MLFFALFLCSDIFAISPFLEDGVTFFIFCLFLITIVLWRFIIFIKFFFVSWALSLLLKIEE